MQSKIKIFLLWLILNSLALFTYVYFRIDYLQEARLERVQETVNQINEEIHEFEKELNGRQPESSEIRKMLSEISGKHRDLSVFFVSDEYYQILEIARQPEDLKSVSVLTALQSDFANRTLDPEQNGKPVIRTYDYIEEKKHREQTLYSFVQPFAGNLRTASVFCFRLETNAVVRMCLEAGLIIVILTILTALFYIRLKKRWEDYDDFFDEDESDDDNAEESDDTFLKENYGTETVPAAEISPLPDSDTVPEPEISAEEDTAPADDSAVQNPFPEETFPQEPAWYDSRENEAAAAERILMGIKAETSADTVCLYIRQRNGLLARTLTLDDGRLKMTENGDTIAVSVENELFASSAFILNRGLRVLVPLKEVRGVKAVLELSSQRQISGSGLTFIRTAMKKFPEKILNMYAEPVPSLIEEREGEISSWQTGIARLKEAFAEGKPCSVIMLSCLAGMEELAKNEKAAVLKYILNEMKKYKGRDDVLSVYREYPAVFSAGSDSNQAQFYAERFMKAFGRIKFRITDERTVIMKPVFAYTSTDSGKGPDDLLPETAADLRRQISLQLNA